MNEFPSNPKAGDICSPENSIEVYVYTGKQRGWQLMNPPTLEPVFVQPEPTTDAKGNIIFTAPAYVG